MRADVLIRHLLTHSSGIGYDIFSKYVDDTVFEQYL